MYTRSVVLTVVNFRNVIFWVMTPCSIAHAVFLNLAFESNGRSMARRSGAVVATALWIRERVTHRN
jgi:hypothetical protein